MMCKPVLAYQSKNGNLYTSEAECQRHNKLWDETQRNLKIRDILTKASGYTPLCTNMHYHRDWYRIEEVHYKVIEGLTKNWKELRDALNTIEE